MTISRRVIPAAFGPGIDTGKDAKLVAEGFLKLENLVFPRQGCMTIRNGTSQIDAAGGTNTEANIASYKDSPVLFDRNLKVGEAEALADKDFNTSATLDLWQVDHGTRLQVEETIRTTTSASQPYNVEVVEWGNLRVWSYTKYNSVGTTYDVIVETYNRWSNRRIDKQTLITPAGNNTSQRLLLEKTTPRISVVYLLAGVPWGVEINPTTGAIGTAQNSGATSYAVNYQFDAVYVDANTIVCAGRDNVGNNLRISSLNASSNFAENTSANLAAADVDNVGVWKRSSDSHACIGFFLGTAYEIRFCIYDEAATQVLGSTLIRTMPAGTMRNLSGVSESATQEHMLLTERTGTDWSYVRYASIDPSGPTTSNSQIIRKACVASKPWIANSQVFFWVTFGDRSSAMLYDASGNLCGKLMPERIYGYDEAEPVATGYVPVTYTDRTDTKWKTCLRRKEMREGKEDSDTAIPVLVETFRPTVGLHCIEVQDGLHIPGSLPYVFDGTNLVEQGYIYPPEAPSATTAGGGNMQQGTYLLAITVRWRETNGRLHETAPSAYTVVDTNAGERLQLTIPYYCHTRKTDAVVCVWRSKVNESVMYLLTTVPNETLASADDTTFYNGDADSTLTGKQQLYTAGYPSSVLENIGPPSYFAQTMHDGRHFVVDDEYPSTRVRYSKEFAPGLAVEHNDVLVVSVPPEGGEIKALGSHMDRLFVFKEHVTYMYTGKGLGLTGGGLGYQGPYVVSEGHGTTSQKFVIAVDEGVMFKSNDRIYLISKGLSVEPIGDAVRYYTDEDSPGALTFKAVVHLPKEQLVVWMTTGVALVYNTLFGVWSTFTAHACTDATVCNNVLVFHNSTGETWYQNSATWKDGATAVVPTIETGHFQFGGLGAEHIVDFLLLHLYKIASGSDGGKIHAAFQYDQDPYWLDAQEYALSGITNFDESAYHGAGSSSYADKAGVIEYEIGRDLCSAMRVKIWMSGHAGTTRTVEFIGMSFIAGVAGTKFEVGGVREASVT